jgi:long-chain acyl-CoA synthetase
MSNFSLVNASTLTFEERDNLDRMLDYSAVQSLPEVWKIAAQQFSDRLALQAPHLQPALTLTYGQLWQKIQQFASGLQTLGVRAGDRVALFSENSPTWFVVDQGIMLAGAADVVRSSQADFDELGYILRNSEATTLVVENQRTLAGLMKYVHELSIQRVILLSHNASDKLDATALTFDQVLEMGATHEF